MADEFNEPGIGIGKVYTRTGDQGETALVGGQRVPKDDLRIEAYGTVDELNAVLGQVRVLAAVAEGPSGAAGVLPLQAAAVVEALDARILHVQHVLFNLGSELATLPDDIGPRQPRVRDADVEDLERWMDEATRGLPALTSFVLPGGSALNAQLHLGRTVCRRAERLAVALHRDGGCDLAPVRYLNRLSDACFVWARQAAQALGHDEVLWDPNQTTVS